MTRTSGDDEDRHWRQPARSIGPRLREATEREPRHRPWLGAVLAGGVAVAWAALVGIPREHAPLPPVARYALTVALPRWRITEPVNEVVYGTRGFDTFGETFLLLAAVVSVVLLTRSREPRRGYFGEDAAGRAGAGEIDPARAPTPPRRRARRPNAGSRRRGPGGTPATPDTEPLGTPAPETAEAMTVVVRTAIRIARRSWRSPGCTWWPGATRRAAASPPAR